MSLSKKTDPWRTDYQVYRQLCIDGCKEAIADAAMMKALQEKYPGVDIPKSLEFAMNTFWILEKDGGWTNKKRKHVRQINMERTLIDSLEWPKNRIPKSSFSSTPKEEPKTPAQLTRQQWEQEQAEVAECAKISKLATEIGELIWKLPNRVEVLDKFSKNFQTAIDEHRELPYLEAVMKGLKEKVPQLFKVPEPAPEIKKREFVQINNSYEMRLRAQEFANKFRNTAQKHSMS
jgi:hypothetical protein